MMQFLYVYRSLYLQCRRRHVTHKYALPEDPDDIGYRRPWVSDCC